MVFFILCYNFQYEILFCIQDLDDSASYKFIKVSLLATSNPDDFENRTRLYYDGCFFFYEFIVLFILILNIHCLYLQFSRKTDLLQWSLSCQCDITAWINFILNIPFLSHSAVRNGKVLKQGGDKWKSLWLIFIFSEFNGEVSWCGGAGL